MNDQPMYELSTPTQPDHLADITAGIRSPARVEFTEEQLATGTPLPVSPHFAEALAGSEAFHRALAASMEERVQKSVRPEYIAGSRTDPYGMRFPWGPITEQHQIGPYTILEYLEDTSTYDNASAWERHGRTLYHIYVDGKNTAVSATSLDSALAGAIAWRREGPNSHAGDYFMRMVSGD